jgi:ParB/RepB/Spo0J family partition protein
MSKNPMSTRQQRDIGSTFDSDLARLASPVLPPRPVAEVVRRRRDTASFLMPVAWIERDETQVRQLGRSKDDPELQELAKSIASDGLQNPIVVSEIVPDQRYRIVSGEGRFVAATEILGLKEVRVTVVDADPERILWMQLHENIHRRNLHPLDLARAIQTAIDGGLSLAGVAEKLCKTETWVQKALTVARGLTEEAREHLMQTPKGQSLETAYEVATVAPEKQGEIARTIAEENLPQTEVRKLTARAKRDSSNHPSGRTGRRAKQKPYHLKWRHESGITVTVEARKRDVPDESIIAALRTLLTSLEAKGQGQAA